MSYLLYGIIQARPYLEFPTYGGSNIRIESVICEP